MGELQLDSDREHKESDGDDKEHYLEENGSLEPLRKAHVRKTETYEQRAAGGVEDVGITVGEEVGEDDDRGADALDGSEGEHGDDQNCLCGCARDKEFNNEDERVQKYHRKVGRDVRHGIVEIVEYRVQNIALLSDICNTEGYKNDYDRGKNVLNAADKAIAEIFERSEEESTDNDRADDEGGGHKYHRETSQ